MQSPPFPRYLSLLGPNILLNTLFSNTLSFLSSRNSLRTYLSTFRWPLRTVPAAHLFVPLIAAPWELHPPQETHLPIVSLKERVLPKSFASLGLWKPIWRAWREESPWFVFMMLMWGITCYLPTNRSFWDWRRFAQISWYFSCSTC